MAEPPADPESAPARREKHRVVEHWALHRMDLVRYADSHGSEGDPEIR
jgi:hypothetical protein